MSSFSSVSGELGSLSIISMADYSSHAPWVDAFEIHEPGRVFGARYEVLEHMRNGSMGAIYRVRYIGTPQQYALKTLGAKDVEAILVQRFKNEAQAISKLAHPNIVRVHDYGFDEGDSPFYVMDLLQGQDLETMLKEHGPLPPAMALPIFIDLCSGFNYAHEQGMLHRDVKPGNFFLLRRPDASESCVKIIDFGIVKFVGELFPEAQGLTAVGAICGSPGYMSPECSGGLTVDSRSDIYSLGCALFEALTGRIPYHGRTVRETMTLHHTEPVPKLESVVPGRTFPANLGLVIEKMLAKHPDDRYPTMAAVAQDLKNVVDGVALGTVQALPENFGTASGTFDALPAFSPLVELRIAAVQHGERDGAVNGNIRTGAALEQKAECPLASGGNKTSVAGLFSNPMVLVGIMLVLAMAICCAIYSSAVPAGH
jgi:eukaryotic-like serine/threonine-protein kinase